MLVWKWKKIQKVSLSPDGLIDNKMGETIILHKPGTEKFKEWGIKSKQRIRRFLWANEKKQQIDLDAKGHKAGLYVRELEVVPTLKGFGVLPGPIKKLSEVYILAWQTLKERGFPVVETVRRIDDSRVAITDLTANGWGVYDIKIDGVSDRAALSTDAAFSKIPLEKVTDEAALILKRANEQGVRLPDDGGMHFLVNKKGDWKFLLLDISQAIIYFDPNKMPQRLQENNRADMEFWLQTIKTIQQTIIKNRK